jgi:hypothetical protein
LFIIPCKFDSNYPVIFECIDSIMRFHPNEKIVIVDSDSNDKSYFQDIDSSVVIYDVENRHYALEAYNIGYKNNPEEDFYYCIHDSLVLKDNIDFVKSSKLTTIRWWDSPPVPIGRDANDNDLSVWADSVMRESLGYGIPGIYKGVFGPMMLCQNQVMKDLSDCGFFNILPNNKHESCATERILGMVLQNLGYDVTNSLQGVMGDFYGSYDERYVKKNYLLRM